MAQRTVAEPAGPGGVRNVLLAGSPGAGRSTLVAALLAASGTSPSAARLTWSYLRHGGVQVNLLDPPGYADLAGELRAADAVLFVVSAADGVDDATAELWEECATAGLPRAVAITRLDHPDADPDGTLAECQEAFGEGVLPVYQPMLGDDGDSVAGLLGLLTLRVLDYSAGYPPRVGEAEREHLTPIKDDRELLIEAIIAESEDETLTDRWVAGDLVSTDALLPELARAVARGHLHPVVPVCAATGVGLDALLDGLVSAAPSPLEHDLPVVTGADGSPRPPLTGDPDGPLVAEVVRVAAGQALVRVYSGTLRPGTVPSGSGPAGPCPAGDLCVLTGADGLTPGDTLSDPGDPLLLLRP